MWREKWTRGYDTVVLRIGEDEDNCPEYGSVRADGIYTHSHAHKGWIFALTLEVVVLRIKSRLHAISTPLIYVVEIGELMSCVGDRYV